MGRTFRPSYKAKKPDGTFEIREMAWWYIEYKDASGRVLRRKAAPSKSVPEEILRKVETDVAKEKVGLPTQNLGEIRLADLRDRYLAAQKGRINPDFWGSLHSRIGFMLVGTKSVFLRDLTMAKVEAYLGSLSEGEDPYAARTINTYLQATKTMLNWSVTARIIPYNPLLSLKPRSERIKAIPGGALTGHEVARFLDVAPRVPLLEHQRLRKHPASPQREAELLRQGEQFALIWRMLIYTGLRCNELRCLRWDDLDLDGGVLTVRAATSKSGKFATLPMAPDLVEILKHWREKTKGKPGEVVVWTPKDLADHIRVYLKAAEIPFEDESGRRVDAHALRHTFGTVLSRAGVDPQTLKDLMRHSSITTTYGFYVHGSQSRMRSAVEALAEPRVPALKSGTAG